jgi:hypothetical protein
MTEARSSATNRWNVKILNDDECEQWLAAHRYDYNAPVRAKGREGHVSLPADGMRHVFEMPSDAATQLPLAHRLARWLGGPDVLLWFTAWAVYRPEQMAVFCEYRRRFGEQRRLIDAPGHLLEMTRAEDVWAAGQLLLFMTAFNWEGFVLQGDRRSVIWMADEIVETYTRDPEKAAEVKSMMEELGLLS